MEKHMHNEKMVFWDNERVGGRVTKQLYDAMLMNWELSLEHIGLLSRNTSLRLNIIDRHTVYLLYHIFIIIQHHSFPQSAFRAFRVPRRTSRDLRKSPL